jgi:hypothetical protein
MLPVPTKVPLYATLVWVLPISPASNPSVRSDSCSVALAFAGVPSEPPSDPKRKPLAQTKTVRPIALGPALNDAGGPVAAQPIPTGAAQVSLPRSHA